MTKTNLESVESFGLLHLESFLAGGARDVKGGGGSAATARAVVTMPPRYLS